ncbi:ribosome biogenesis GTPase Der [bacterium]|nr:ribosome biogenesis GTPase Der [bacterium]MCB2201548.1 ribosome biogenesis GTPase Der [bacterium]
MNLPTVAIVGRPNVGKSSLFNRCIRQRRAVVDSQPGVTRDRNYAVCEWAGREFRLVDTGGIVPNSDDLMEKLIVDQVEFALSECDLVLLVVDTQIGIDPTERQIAARLHQTKRPCLLIANKSDNDVLQNDTYEFLGLGLGDPLPVSATVGRGIGEMLDAVVERLPEPEVDDRSEEGVIRVALVGRPNVGKSSFVNKLIGEERLIVSPIAGTTRDSVDTPVEIDGRPYRYVFIDTAGLRRKYKVRESLEFFTTLRTTRAIESCDVAVVLTDADAGLSTQDQHIIEQIVTTRRAGVLAVNKWDLIEKDGMTAVRFEKMIQERIAKFEFLPIVFISALTGQRLTKVLDLVDHVYEQHNRTIPTSELNDFLQAVFAHRKPPAKQGKFIQLKYITQTETAPPTFVIFANKPEMIDKAYIQYLTNQLRKKYGFEGVPIRLKFRQK